MKEIKPTYITFEQAKWLKEKGFDESCRMLINGAYEPFHLNLIETQYFQNNSVLLKDCYSAPEQWQVVEWLRINHGIWISVGNVYSEYTHWAYGIGKENKGMILPFREGQDNHDYFNSPQEAYSAAFDYIKDNNLI
jgi:hypothetical protein